MQIVSWNVNGLEQTVWLQIREWLQSMGPDIVCLQETKIDPSRIPLEQKAIAGHVSAWHVSKKKSYAGVATYYRKDLNLIHAQVGLGDSRFDTEGRAVTMVFNDWVLIKKQPRNSFKLSVCEQGSLGGRKRFVLDNRRWP